MPVRLHLEKGLEKMRDLNGNELVINENGVSHPSGAFINFLRDAAGRIYSIIDPMNKSISYIHTPAGDL